MLSERLRKLREHDGATRDELADALGVQPSTVKHWENGFRSPNEARIRTIAEFYGLTMVEFYSFGEVE